MKKLSSPSIILEWETVQQGGLSRASAGLREVRNQLAELAPELDRPAEVIICYDAAVIREKDLTSFVQQAASPHEWPCPVLLSECPSANYYEKKNIGARQAQNDVVLFFDTDLLPDPGWLKGMLTPFQQWEVPAVVGATYLDHACLYDMAVALFWIFRTAMPASPLRTTKNVISNNLAVRRPLFLQFGFPDRPIYRGQCAELGIQMIRAGLTMYEQTGARARHPPPPARKFFMRAWHAGQDLHFYAVIEGKASIAAVWALLCADYSLVAKRIAERSLNLKPSSTAKLLAWVLGLTYYTIKATAYLAAQLQIRSVKHALRAQP
jgi:hypothetical protein